MAPTPRRKPRQRWLWGTAAALAAGAAVFGIGEAVIVIAMVTGMASLLLRGDARRTAYGALEKLPFPVVHDPPLGAVTHEPLGRPIGEVALRFGEPLDGEDGRRAAVRLGALAPDLGVHVDRDEITVSRWSWGDQDVLLLAEVLTRWAVALHAEHPIAEVAVRWKSSGPGYSM